MWGMGAVKCVIYNLSLPQRPQIKWNLLKFFLRGLPTVDKIAHFTFVSPLCWLCRKAKESRVHLLEECLKSQGDFENYWEEMLCVKDSWVGEC